MALSPTSSRGTVLPSQWTTSAHGGLTIAPDDAATVPLTLILPAGATVPGTVGLLVRSLDKIGDNNNVFFVDAYGDATFETDVFQGGGIIYNSGAGNVLELSAANLRVQIPTGKTFKFNDHTDALKFGVNDTGGVQTAPPVSAASTLALGTAYQNTLGYDVMLLICLNVTVNTSGVLKLGVGPTSTPTQTNIISGVTTTGQWNIPIYLPASYYALLSVTGTITVAIDGQIALPI